MLCVCVCVCVYVCVCVCVCVDVCVCQGKDGRWSKKATIATSHAPITRPPVILTSVSLLVWPPTTERHSIHHLRQVDMAVTVDIKHTEESCGYVQVGEPQTGKRDPNLSPLRTTQEITQKFKYWLQHRNSGFIQILETTRQRTSCYLHRAPLALGGWRTSQTC